MQTGKLDQRVEFQRLIETNDGGSLTKEWSSESPPDEVWAEVITQRGNEVFEAARINARETIRVRVRWRTDVDDTMRLIWLGQAYSIKWTDRASRRKDGGYLWLTAEVVGAL